MTNKLWNSLVILAVGGMLFAGSAAAQTATTTTSTTAGAGPNTVDPGHPRVNEVNRRETRQQKRIAQGIKNGALSPQESANLEKQEAALQKTEQKDMAEHNGHLTKAEQRRPNLRENHISPSTPLDKHN